MIVMNLLKIMYFSLSLIIISYEKIYTIDIVTAIAHVLALQNINNSAPQPQAIRTGLYYEVYNRWHNDVQLNYGCNLLVYHAAIAPQSYMPISCTAVLDSICAEPYSDATIVQGCATKKARKDYRTFYITESLCNHNYRCGDAQKTMSLNRGVGSPEPQTDDVLRHPCVDELGKNATYNPTFMRNAQASHHNLRGVGKEK